MRPWCHNLANRYNSIEIENIRQNVDSKSYEILETTIRMPTAMFGLQNSWKARTIL